VPPGHRSRRAGVNPLDDGNASPAAVALPWLPAAQIHEPVGAYGRLGNALGSDQIKGTGPKSTTSPSTSLQPAPRGSYSAPRPSSNSPRSLARDGEICMRTSTTRSRRPCTSSPSPRSPSSHASGRASDRRSATGPRVWSCRRFSARRISPPARAASPTPAAQHPRAERHGAQIRARSPQACRRARTAQAGR
jgi:hypothetical protein